MASDPTKDNKVNHATQGVDFTKHNDHSKVPHGLNPNLEDVTTPFLSNLDDEGEYHCSNTPNGCVYGDISGKDGSPGPLFEIQGPRMNMFHFTNDRKDWDGNRSGE